MGYSSFYLFVLWRLGGFGFNTICICWITSKCSYLFWSILQKVWDLFLIFICDTNSKSMVTNSFYITLNEVTIYNCSYLDGLLAIIYVTLLNRRMKPYTALVAAELYGYWWNWIPFHFLLCRYFNMMLINGSTAHKIIRGSIYREMLSSVSSSIKYNSMLIVQ